MPTLPALIEAMPGVIQTQLPDTPHVAPLVYAQNDRDIVSAWLSRSGLSATTVRNLKKDADRFLLWLESRGQVLRTVRFEDFSEYSMFLLNPEPKEVWISKTKWPRQDPRWRPFTGPLSDVSHKKTLETIKGLFAWCALARYLDANPAALIGKINAPKQTSVERYLPMNGIALMLDACDKENQGTWRDILKVARRRFLVSIFYFTGARLHEIATADMNSIRPDHQGAWWLHVLGKGSVHGKIPVPPDLLVEFKRYRHAFGFSGFPEAGDTMPLILPITGPRRPVVDNVIHKDVKSVMVNASRLAEIAGDAALSMQLAAASAHWLRHSTFTHQLDGGVPLKTVQKNARHSSINTTSLYLHKTDADRHAETVAVIKIKR